MWFSKMVGLVLSILFVSLVTNLNVKADASKAWQKKLIGYLSECWQEYNLTPKEMEDLRNMKMPETESVRCYFACTYKKAGLMTEKGEFWDEGVRKSSLEQYGDDEAIVKKIDQFIEICKKVNDEPVSDGEKGCERAALMFKCTAEHAHNLGLE